MKRKTGITVGIGLIIAFALWTALVCFVDVRAIGPLESKVGFATLNGHFHKLTGTSLWLYVVTDWLGLVPIAVAVGFGSFGLVQWIRRKGFFAVDRGILALGVFYIAVMAVYALFELVVINRRPVLINGYLEASYPSSTTMLVMTVMPTAAMQLREYIKNKTAMRLICLAIILFTAFMVVGRLISGVHWLSDIIGGMLISGGLVILYYVFRK